MMKWYLIDARKDETFDSAMKAETRSDARQELADAWSALTQHDRELRDDFFAIRTTTDADGCVDYDAATDMITFRQIKPLLITREQVRDALREAYDRAIHTDSCEYRVSLDNDGDLRVDEHLQGDIFSVPGWTTLRTYCMWPSVLDYLGPDATGTDDELDGLMTEYEESQLDDDVDGVLDALQEI